VQVHDASKFFPGIPQNLRISAQWNLPTFGTPDSAYAILLRREQLMKFRVSLCAQLLDASLVAHADNRVHTVQSAQTIEFSDDSQDSPGRVAIDGNFAIVISYCGGGRLAYLYQRGADGEWTVRATLLAVQTTMPAQDDDVAMANGLHAYVNDVFVAGAIDSPIAKGQHGIGTSGSAATFQRFDVEQP